MGHHRGKLVSSTDPEYESRIQAALMDVANGTCNNISVAARVHKEDIKIKVFNGSLSSYKYKDDLITITGALSLPRDGTMNELTARIKEHLAGNSDCASQPRFAGLLGGK
ncbi:hypothetical protein EDB19DRAFT_1912112 [Suillus lakei]|nr:hypothetical protein EDB19DRAFT_1912112 [Suillus lakei]